MKYNIIDKEMGKIVDLNDEDGYIFRLKPDGDLVVVDWKGRESAPLNDEYDVKMVDE